MARCRIAECSERRFPRTVAQLWLTSYRAWSDALSASASQSALFSMVKYFQNVYGRRSSTMAHSGPPAERGGEVALKKPAHHTLARVWLATVLSRICPPLFMGRSRLIASHRSCDATLQEEIIGVVKCVDYAAISPLERNAHSKTLECVESLLNREQIPSKQYAKQLAKEHYATETVRHACTLRSAILLLAE